MRVLVGMVLMGLAAGFAGQVAAQWDCMDDVYAVVDGDRITVLHIGALYNCCPTRFDYEVALEGQQITVTEIEILEQPCACLCCIDLEVEIADVPPGSYTLEFWWLEYDINDWVMWPLEVVVPDVGQPITDPAVAETFQSDCYDWTAAAEPAPWTTWGQVKALYR